MSKTVSKLNATQGSRRTAACSRGVAIATAFSLKFSSPSTSGSNLPHSPRYRRTVFFLTCLEMKARVRTSLTRSEYRAKVYSKVFSSVALCTRSFTARRSVSSSKFISWREPRVFPLTPVRLVHGRPRPKMTFGKEGVYLGCLHSC